MLGNTRADHDKGCNQNMKKLCVLCLSAVLFCSAILFLPTAHDRAIYDKMLRLHVLANSDSQEDQANKLAVRDKVLEVLSEEMQNCSSRNEAETLILDKGDQLLNACREVLGAQGSDHTVEMVLTEEYYPTRQYEKITLPAGKYLSLQIRIGEARGQNWWCVLYPPVCLGACSVKDELAGAGFDSDQVKLVSEEKEIRYAVKFKVLEAVGKFFGRLFD